MSSRTLSSVLRSRASVFKTRQSQPIPRVSCPSLGQTRSFAPNGDDPFNDDHDAPQSEHKQANDKLQSITNSVPLDTKIRFVQKPSEESNLVPDNDLLNAIFKPTPRLPYTVGTDICHIPHVRRILERQTSDLDYIRGTMPRFWTRVLHPIEARGWKSEGGLTKNVDFIAGRWAAKEAIIKAFSAAYPTLNKVFMHDIVVLNSKVQMAFLEARKAALRIKFSNGRHLHPGAWGFRPQELGEAPRAFVRVPESKEGWVEISVSISHDGDYATATALVPVDPKITEVSMEKGVVRGVVAKAYKDGRREIAKTYNRDGRYV
ncbi:hypothetical protein VE03_05479 [Pseudogymnoascus sp. 23342-1-I1]|nr:hypothetical protein VE03_05479 [Pseudogymnoascus sp. 23342-1-I1]